MSSKLPVIEIFGPTIQGEGAAIGLKTMFVRLYGCDYRCAWCDSAFTWDGSSKFQVRSLTVEQIISELHATGADSCAYVTISGGNPALYGEPVQELIRALHNAGKKVIVETQGSLWQDWFPIVDLLTVSPKPPSSGMATDWDILDMILRQLQEQPPSLKVVVFDEADFAFAKQVHRQYPEVPFYLQVGNDDIRSPGNISEALLKKLEWLFALVINDPELTEVRVLPQLHALIWHNERGK